MGIQKKDYQEIQAIKAEEEFKFSTNQRIQNLQTAIDKTNNLLASTIAVQGSNKQDCDLQVDEVMRSCMASLKEFRRILDDFELMIQANKNLVNQVMAQQKLMVEQDVFNEKISRLEQEVQQLRREKESFKRDAKDQNHRLIGDFSSQLKAMKEEILNIPSEIPAMKKLFDQKFEIVELNGQNAVLRSSNNEKQIMLVERKIDNIYQLIKKIELSMQEAK